MYLLVYPDNAEVFAIERIRCQRRAAGENIEANDENGKR